MKVLSALLSSLLLITLIDVAHAATGKMGGSLSEDTVTKLKAATNGDKAKTQTASDATEKN